MGRLGAPFFWFFFQETQSFGEKPGVLSRQEV